MIRKTVYARTRKDCQKKLMDLRHRSASGSLIAEDMTVEDYLRSWLSHSAEPTVGRGTFVRYRGLVDNYLIPRLGKLKLQKVNATHVEQLYSDLRSDRCPKSIPRQCHIVLRRAFTVAMEKRLIQFNPCAKGSGVRTPKTTPRPIAPLTKEQAVRLLTEAEDDRFHALFVLAIHAGLRQGELLGLKWDNVDLAGGSIRVTHSLEETSGTFQLKEPKTKAGRRLVKIPGIAVKALHRHRAMMKSEGLGFSEWVFPDTIGGAQRKSNLNRWHWKPLKKAAGLPETTRFHDLRHTHATLLLAAGTHPKVVQERLGHANIVMTLYTYSHVIPSLQQEAADKLDELFTVDEPGGSEITESGKTGTELVQNPETKTDQPIEDWSETACQ